MIFKDFKQLIQNNIKALLAGQVKVFITDIDKDSLWVTYLSSFPKEMEQEFTCNSCRQFIKNFANVVVIKDNKMQSIWAVEVGDPVYQKVADDLNELVTSAKIKEVFFAESKKIGVDNNIQMFTDGTTVKWEHFYYECPKEFVTPSGKSIEACQAGFRDAKNVFERSLKEITKPAIETVLELIAQNSLYRGAEFKGILENFLQCKILYDRLPQEDRDCYCWVTSITQSGAVSKIRGTSIGTMLVDISGDMDLDEAVSRFEKIMAPTNYKRPAPIISKKMVEDAEKTIEDLGLKESLGRKLCKPDDIDINDLLFVNRDMKVGGDIFDDLKNDTPINPKTLAKVEEISLEDFINKVIPKANTIEVLLENKHIPNLVSVVGPENKGAKSLFKWKNGFSWSYHNAMADSLKEKVKTAGGKVDGVLRISLEWFDRDDLDLHVHEPNKNHIYFGNPQSRTGGHLDVDMNAHSIVKNPVENIIYPHGSPIPDGNYTVIVNNFNERSSGKKEFSVEIEYKGEIFTFSAPSPTVRRDLTVANFSISKKDGIKFDKNVRSTVSSQNVWGLDTNKFHKVSMAMFSPNYWGDSKIGNQHVFFALDNAVNQDENVRGFFNEFLDQDLEKAHKRVFEVLAGRMKVEKDNNAKQVSGVGFSTTTNNSFVCKVTGAFSRMLKVNI